MKVVVIDDERAMQLIMQNMLAKIAGVDVAGVFGETASAESFMAGHEVHLVFVDIQLPNESGIAFARRLAESGRDVHVVFVTSHKEYALEAFEVYALDYLVKPVSPERLAKTVRRAMAMQPPQDAPDGGESRPLVIQGLGGLFARSKQGGAIRWRTNKCAELFAFLLLNRGRSVSRERVIADVFAGMPEKNAVSYLNTTVYQLRKTLEPHGLKYSIRSENGGYRLELAEADIDFIILEQRLKAFKTIDGSNLEAAREAETLYTGDLFGERACLWSLHESERLARLYESFSLKLAAAMLRENDAASAIVLLKKLMQRNELNEEALGLLLTACAAQRDKQALEKHYGRYIGKLRKELGIGPSRELSALYADLLKRQ